MRGGRLSWQKQQTLLAAARKTYRAARKDKPTD